MNQLAGRQYPGVVTGGGGFLRGLIEQTDGFDRIAQELQAQRFVVGGRINVHDAAADAELAWDFHDRRPPVAEPEQARDQHVALHRAAGRKPETGCGEHGAREQAVQQGGHGGDQQGALAGRQAVQRPHPPRDQFDKRRRRFVGQGFPFGKERERLR